MRRVQFLLTLFLTSALATAVHADQLRLSWDHCFGDGNVYNRAFACDTNDGTERLIGSYVLDEPVDNVSGYNVLVDFRTQGDVPLPDWWRFVNAGSCRPSSLGFTFAPTTSPGSCGQYDWIAPIWAGGLSAYRTNTSSNPTPTPGWARLVASGGVAFENLFEVPGLQEVLAFDLRISHARTTGTGSCSGCSTPVCITFSNLRLTRPVGFGDLRLPNGNTEVWRSTVTWQGAQPSAALLSCSSRNSADCEVSVICAIPTPVQNRTWGTLKSLYR